ncbi:MAG: hypothetical protein V3R87_02420 [Dehalococcoidia bacterium]
MSGNTSPQYNRPYPSEPAVHDLPPIRYGEEIIALRLVVRRAEDGSWRGRLVFGSGDVQESLATAEIFFGAMEPDLWDSVRDLRDHHIRDLYRSLIAE